MSGAVTKFDDTIFPLPEDQAALVGRVVYRLDTNPDQHYDDSGYYLLYTGRLFKSVVGDVETLWVLYQDSYHDTNHVEPISVTTSDTGIVRLRAADSGQPWYFDPVLAAQWVVDRLQENQAKDMAYLQKRLHDLITKATGGQS